MEPERTTHSRRGFLDVAAGASAGIAAASFSGVLGIGTAAAGESVATILNLATTAEMLAVTFYYTGITGAGFHIGEPALGHLRRTMDAEAHHLQILQSMGGVSLQQRFFLPDRLLSDAGVFAHTGIQIETSLAAAYLAATHRFAALGRAALATTTAQLGASEAQHLTLISHLAGLIPNGQTLPRIESPAGAAPFLAPFLRGGDGFGRAATFPAAAAYQAAIGDTRAERMPPFVQLANVARPGGSPSQPAARATTSR